MFNVLVIAYYYPPLGLSGVQRTLKFTKYFQEFGWQTTVITTGKIAYFAYDETLLKEAENAGVKIVRTEAFNPNSVLKKGVVNMPSTWLMKLLGRISKTIFIPDNKIFWSYKAAKLANKLLKEKNYDAIFVSVPPFSSIFKILSLKKKYDVPVFVDYRDAWLTNQFRFYPTPLHRILHKRMEDKVLRTVDRVLVVNRAVKEDLLNEYKFLSFKDVDIFVHGFDPEDFENLKPLPKENEKMILTYAGIFYEGITPKYLLKAFKKLTLERPDIAANIELHFVGHLKRENKRIIKKLKLESFVKEFGYLTHIESVRRIVSSDILWVMLPNDAKMHNVTPGKLFEYFGTKKPILGCLPEGVAKNSLKEYEASFITKPHDIDEIKSMIINIYELYVKNQLPKPNLEYIDQHNRRYLAFQLTKIFQFYLKSL